ncbi:MAG: ArnT family glycosyltransferase [Pleurocapsa sp.]
MGRWGDISKLFSDRLLVLSLLVAAVVLYTSGIGNLPLRDWDEGIVAGVARNIGRGSPGSHTWLYPTINFGDPYWNKPPLIHWLIALAYRLFGISEWSTRVVPAILSAFAVPLLYLIGREIFPSCSTAVFSALVYLTLLPVARHSRIAMLDGAIACWFCLAVWCLLRGRKHRPWLLGAGLAIGLVCLTKGIMMGVLLGGMIIIFVAWDSPKLLTSLYLWSGFIFGVIPAITWYGLQYLHYGAEFLGTNLGTQTFNRIWKPVSSVSGSPWYYLLEIAKYSLPWLIFLPYGFKLAWQNRYVSWGKLTLVWTSVYLLAISLMATKLPWYVIPIYPGLSLLIGASLSKAWSKQAEYFQKVSLSLVAIACGIGSAYYGLVYTAAESGLTLILIVVTICFTLASALVWLGDRYFILVMITGFYLALLLLFNSHHWLWELNEAFPVKPLAQILKQYTPPQQTIYTAYPNLRPSLEFYSDRVVIPVSDEQLKQYWQQAEAIYLLVDDAAIDRLNLQPHQKLGTDLDNVPWQLITQADIAFLSSK